MTTAECAKAYLLPRLPLRVRLLPAITTDGIIDAWCLNHGKLKGNTLVLRIREHLRDTKTDQVRGIETILLQVLLSIAINWLIKALQAWWDGRHAA